MKLQFNLLPPPPPAKHCVFYIFCYGRETMFPGALGYEDDRGQPHIATITKWKAIFLSGEVLYFLLKI